MKIGARILLLSVYFLVTVIRPAHADDTPLIWYASRSLSDHVDWGIPSLWSAYDLMRAGYVMAVLSSEAYKSASGRIVAPLGLREVSAISQSRTISRRDAGTVIQIASNLPAGVIGGQSIASITPSAYAFVAQDANGTASFVAVRGSSDFDDALLDANAATVSAGGVLLHHGFYIYSALLYDSVRSSLGNCTQPIWLTGHSLGGASATVLAYWLRNAGCNVQGVVTFGAPAAGRSSFSVAYNALGLSERTHRFEGEHDIVPCTPLGPNWGRVGSRHLVRRDGSVVLNRNENTCDGIGEGFEASAYGYFVAAHEALDIVPEAADWIKSGVQQAGLCQNPNLASRILLGILTSGASELVCKSIDDVSNALAAAGQVVHLSTVLFAGKVFRDHAISVYRERLVAGGSSDGDAAFCGGLWETRMQSIDEPKCTGRR